MNISVTDIYVFAIGELVFDDDLQPLTTRHGGQHYFRLPSLDKLQDTFDEIIGKSYLKLKEEEHLNLLFALKPYVHLFHTHSSLHQPALIRHKGYMYMMITGRLHGSLVS